MYCLKCRKKLESKNPNIVRTKKERIMVLSKYAVSDSKNWKFIKEQKPSRLLSSLGMKTPLSNITLLDLLWLVEDKLIDA